MLSAESVKPPAAFLIEQLECLDLPDSSTVGILKEQAALKAQAREEKAAKQLLKGLLNTSLVFVQACDVSCVAVA